MRVAHGLVLGVLVAVPVMGHSSARAEQDGEALFNTHCRNCHAMKAGDNRLGPSLHGVIGREAGTAQGFAGYSGALKGFTWDRATLDKFIADPPSVDHHEVSDKGSINQRVALARRAYSVAELYATAPGPQVILPEPGTSGEPRRTSGGKR